MVSLVNRFAAKIEEKKGALSEDEVSVPLYIYVHVYIIYTYTLYPKMCVYVLCR